MMYRPAVAAAACAAIASVPVTYAVWALIAPHGGVVDRGSSEVALRLEGANGTGTGGDRTTSDSARQEAAGVFLGAPRGV